MNASERYQSSGHSIRKFILKNYAGYLLVTPMVIGIMVFIAYPMVKAFLYSFQHTDGITGKWVGLRNYIWILSDSIFWTAVYNTFYMAVLGVSANLIVCVILASLINSLNKGKNFFKAVYFLPNVFSIIAISMVFEYLFYPTDSGIINYAIGFLGISPGRWFTSTAMAPISIVIMGVWRSMGYDTLLFIAGLQSIPKEYYEAAKVDGATGLKKWFYITLPCLKPMIVFIVIIATINCLKRFADVWMIGGVAGNPGGALDTVVLYIYRNAWTMNNIGVSSSAAYILFLFSIILTVINYRVLGLGRNSN